MEKGRLPPFDVVISSYGFCVSSMFQQWEAIPAATTSKSIKAFFCLQPCQVQTEETDRKMHFNMHGEKPRRRLVSFAACLKRVCMTQLDRSICLARKMYRFKRSERVFARDISLFKGLVRGCYFLLALVCFSLARCNAEEKDTQTAGCRSSNK